MIQNFRGIEEETVKLTAASTPTRTMSRVILALMYANNRKTKKEREDLLKHWLCKFLQVPDTKFLVDGKTAPASITMFVHEDKGVTRVEYEIGRGGKVAEVSRGTDKLPRLLLVPKLPVLADGSDLMALCSNFKTDSLDVVPVEFFSKLLLPEKRNLESCASVLQFLAAQAKADVKFKDSRFWLVENKKELPIGVATQQQQFLLQLLLLARNGVLENTDFLLMEENLAPAVVVNVCELFGVEPITVKPEVPFTGSLTW